MTTSHNDEVADAKGSLPKYRGRCCFARSTVIWSVFCHADSKQ